jgi:hypothetical protein
MTGNEVETRCTCACMDCIEGLHCGVGYPHPDGTPTICLEPPGREGLNLLGIAYDLHPEDEQDDEDEVFWAHYHHCVESGETPPRRWETVTE